MKKTPQFLRDLKRDELLRTRFYAAIMEFAQEQGYAVSLKSLEAADLVGAISDTTKTRRGPVTTMAVGEEEGHDGDPVSTAALGEEDRRIDAPLTSAAIGEEDQRDEMSNMTDAIPEEEHTNGATEAVGEEDGRLPRPLDEFTNVTQAIPEEDGKPDSERFTTLKIPEEDDKIIRNPASSLAIPEEDQPRKRNLDKPRGPKLP